MSRTEAKKRTRQKILKAANRCFARDGFDDTSMRSIASEASCAVGTLFTHFDDKHALLHAVLEHAIDEAIEEALTLEVDDLEDGVREIMRVFFKLWRQDPALSRALLAHSMLTTDEGAASRFKLQVARVFARIEQLYSSAHSAGRLDPSCDPRVAALSCISFYYFTLMSWMQNALPPGRTMEAVFSAMLAQQIHSLTRGRP